MHNRLLGPSQHTSKITGLGLLTLNFHLIFTNKGTIFYYIHVTCQPGTKHGTSLVKTSKTNSSTMKTACSTGGDKKEKKKRKKRRELDTFSVL